MLEATLFWLQHTPRKFTLTQWSPLWMIISRSWSHYVSRRVRLQGMHQIKFVGQRYEVSLPWNEHHPLLHNYFDLWFRWLSGLLRRLKQTPQLLSEYGAITHDQLRKGIVEVFIDNMQPASDLTHFLPHHSVVRQDKTTLKLIFVYGASARACRHSLNDCLYTGPKLDQSLLDILLHFVFNTLPLLVILRRHSYWYQFTSKTVKHQNWSCSIYQGSVWDISQSLLFECNHHLKT